MRINTDFEHAARTALALANVPPAEHAAIITTLHYRLDRAAAEARRNEAIREAYALIGGSPGDMKILSRTLHNFYALNWPRVRHLAEPPEEYKPLFRACFRACQAADDSGRGIPGRRQLERIVFAT